MDSYYKDRFGETDRREWRFVTLLVGALVRF